MTLQQYPTAGNKNSNLDRFLDKKIPGKINFSKIPGNSRRESRDDERFPGIQ